MTGQKVARKPVTPEVEAWITRALAKPGGHGPLPKQTLAVLGAVFGQTAPTAQRGGSP